MTHLVGLLLKAVIKLCGPFLTSDPIMRWRATLSDAQGNWTIFGIVQVAGLIGLVLVGFLIVKIWKWGSEDQRWIAEQVRLERQRQAKAGGECDDAMGDTVDFELGEPTDVELKEATMNVLKAARALNDSILRDAAERHNETDEQHNRN